MQPAVCLTGNSLKDLISTITSDEVFDLAELPGQCPGCRGGYITTEFASLFQGLGSEVTQLVRGPSLLRGFDDDIVAVLDEQLRRRGVRP